MRFNANSDEMVLDRLNLTQRNRLWTRTAFFALFLLAPVLDIFRLDLSLGHFILFGQPWTLGLDPSNAAVSVLNLILRVFVPVGLLVGFGFWLSWRYGRLYCSWLCPHFSVVETINALMRRASGKVTFWQSNPMPAQLSDGTSNSPHSVMWWLVALAVIGFAALWAITFLTYLLPPRMIWSNLLHAELTRNQSLFIGVGTVLLSIEFLLARHLFCRFGCALGLFQSLIWMANPKALVVGFDRSRAHECAGCDASCEHACPMRLKPRLNKRHILACTQCQQCVQACDKVRNPHQQVGLLHLVQGKAALDTSQRDFGNRPVIPQGTYDRTFQANAFRYRIIPLLEKSDTSRSDRRAC